MTSNFQEIEKPGDFVSYRQFLDIHFRHRFALNYVAGKRVLDVGCGSGLGLLSFATTAKEVLAVDNSDEAIRFSKHFTHPHLKVLQCDAHHIPREDGSFDTILCLGAIIYLDIPLFLQECDRLLAPGGVLVGCVANPGHPAFVPSKESKSYPTFNELNELFQAHHWESHFFGIRYDTKSRTLGISSWMRRVSLPPLIQFLNLLPHSRLIKNGLNRFLLAGKRLGQTIKTKDMDDAQQICQLVNIDPSLDHSFFEGIYFVAKK